QLLTDQPSARTIASMNLDLPALARDSSIQPRSTLLEMDRSVKVLALPERFILEDPHRNHNLSKVSPLSEPTASMLVAAFTEDNGNVQALQARLKQLLIVTEAKDSIRKLVMGLPI